MKKILIYVEPHPIRNTHEEFFEAGKLLNEAALNLEKMEGYEFRFFSNDSIVDRLVTVNSELSYKALRMTVAEKVEYQSFFSQWGEKSIETWKNLVRGKGKVTAFYLKVLDRLHQVYNFDAVLLWSDNGAVRMFCEIKGLLALHAELGPTRSPFHKTLYLDPLGTNGGSSAANIDIDKINLCEVIPRETWVTLQGNIDDKPNSVGLIDSSLTLNEQSIEYIRGDRPYVFIPLQLDDDLNTQLYSKYNTVEDFLRELIPQLIDAGFDIVIKGHPGAIHRSHNLVAEAKALLLAKSYGDHVKIMPRNTNSFLTLHVISQSSAVVSINSSVAFESLMIGKRTILCGQGVFESQKLSDTDLSGQLKSEFWGDEKLDKLITFYCGHYFHPIDEVTSGRALKSVFDFLFINRNLVPGTQAYWQAWVEKISFGLAWAYGGKGNYSFNSALDTGNLVGNSRIFKADSKRFLISSDLIKIKGQLNNCPVIASCRLANDNFIGFIDYVKSVEENAVEFLEVSGWCLERGTYQPPVQIILCTLDKVVSHHRVILSRRDVAESLQLPITDKCGFIFRIKKNDIDQVSGGKLLILGGSNISQFAELKEGQIHRS
ncbi:capsular polysaccharide export protein [Pseudomonas duriflava]|uniref:Capsular polysaccharide export protein n=1 Tax=Pseudomonas duriflava TaxID=459528 RepID=A0A562PY07_9PSED|nr:hypothetical protein [Pseudomonas duriflava]TWI49284.1 capsular polysaccharide export protein [Pseudomonas duriflava]